MSVSIHELLRRRLLERAGLVENPAPLWTWDTLRRSQWSEPFEDLMRNRLCMGALRYGPIGDPAKPPYDRVAGMRKRLEQYAADGNTERLVDIANLALLEFVEGKHPRRHWRAIEEDHCCV